MLSKVERDVVSITLQSNFFQISSDEVETVAVRKLSTCRHFMFFSQIDKF